MRSLFLTTAAFAALMLGAPIGTAHAAAVDHRQAAKQACYADGRAHFHAGKLTRSALVDWNDRCDAVASEVDASAGDDDADPIRAKCADQFSSGDYNKTPAAFAKFSKECGSIAE
jgi:hypothetical protein